MAKINQIYLWQENPRLEGDCVHLEDDEEGTIQHKLELKLFHNDEIRRLMHKIREDGGVNEPIYLYRPPERPGMTVVFDGNCRFASVRKLHTDDPNNSRWQTIPAILIEGVDYSTAVEISIRQNVDGQIDWSPYALACSLSDMKAKKMEEGLDEDEAIKAAAEIVKSAHGLQKVKKLLHAREFIKEYMPRDKNKFSAVLEGYITPISSPKNRKIIEEGHFKENEIDQMVLRCIKKEKNFDSKVFRDKLKKVWNGALSENSLKREHFEDLVAGRISLQRASEVIAQTVEGELERKKLNEFLEFIDSSPQSRKHIMRTLAENQELEETVIKIREELKSLIDAAELYSDVRDDN